MRPPDPLPLKPVFTKKRLIVASIIIILIIILASLKGVATFYATYLWFQSINSYQVWKTNLYAKFELGTVFIGSFFIFAWINLLIADKFAPQDIHIQNEDSVVSRYLQIVPKRALLIRTAVSLLLAVFVGSSAISEWQNWLLFTHSQSFGKTDPQFHLDAGFFVFKLPFLSWLSGWVFAALLVTLILSALVHYLNGGISVENQKLKATASVKAHLSLLLGLVGLEKAASYYYVSRPTLDLSSRGVVSGASYTDVHIQLPAISLLTIISIAAAIIFLINIYLRGWKLPVIAVSLWVLVSLIAGVLYPQVIQTFKVQPAQSTLELPYIQRNIEATRFALGLDKINTVSYQASQNATVNQLSNDAPSINDVRLWDWEYTLATYEKYQDIKNYYQFTTLAYDRYMVNGTLTPVIIGIRQINSGGLPAQSWVNQHLQYTHGYGAIISQGNFAANDGTPQFPIGDVPPVSSEGTPTITQPDVYFGVNQGGYVIADSKQAEIDYQSASGNPIESHYQGNGGVSVGSIWRKLTYALYFGDYNILFSNLIESSSQILYNQDIHQRVATVAPFLSLDADPYPIILNGQLYWLQDAYTTSDTYPYSQQATAQTVSALNPNSGLASAPFNYVRNSVKVLVNAYTGKMTFYVMDPSDPIIRAWESIYPHLFTPVSQMSSDLKNHLRYPEDLFSVQAGYWGRYHITNPVDFYNAADSWMISQAPSNNVPNATNQPSPPATPINPNGRYSPNYELVTLPGQSQPSFDLLEPFVPASTSNGSNDKQQILTSFLTASSDPGSYGTLTNYVTPRGQSVDGPALASSRIDSVPAVSQQITLLSQQGSTVTLGTVQILPVGQSLLYIRPMYVASSTNAIPTLKYVIVIYGNNVALEPTLGQALSDVFGATIPGVTSTLGPPTSVSSGQTPGQPSGPTSSEVTSLLAQAQAEFTQANQELSSGNLGAYQSDENKANSYVSQALALSGNSAPSSPSTSSPGAHGVVGTTTTTTLSSSATTTSPTQTSKPPNSA